MNALPLETVRAIATLWNAKVPMRDIIRRTGRSESALRSLIGRHANLFERRRGEALEARLDLAQKLWREGQTSAQLAERLGMTEQAVRSMIKANRARFAYRRNPRAAEVRAPAKPKAGRPARKKPVARKAEFVRGLDRHMAAKSLDLTMPGEPVGLVMLGAQSCRWPVSGSGAETLFCGGEATRGSYCGGHAVLAYQPKHHNR